MSTDITFTTLLAHTSLITRVTVLNGDFQTALSNAHSTTNSFISTHALTSHLLPTPAPITFGPNSPTDPTLRFEVGYIIKEDAASLSAVQATLENTDFTTCGTIVGNRSEGGEELVEGVGLRVTEEGEWAVRIYEGNLKDAGSVWGQFIGDTMGLMEKEGFEADHGRCFAERYISGLEGVREEDVRVQLLIPIKRRV
ncbi:hypothetical protein HK097_002570 [Rhizophlyctis rosea]|uniref:GyrI-like small molecule binding domain-containing protein n=1 Tax=Rhizophlyctis rosea TaxID=64517 RepID=A0AAD5SFF2_9FUNG|nr:hypothetical protein HK097_002570 [Rhizophlyctis rosea]